MDETAISGLSTMASVKVKPARIGEAAVQMECEVRSDDFTRLDENGHSDTSVTYSEQFFPYTLISPSIYDFLLLHRE